MALSCAELSSMHGDARVSTSFFLCACLVFQDHIRLQVFCVALHAGQKSSAAAAAAAAAAAGKTCMPL